jgi:hypothetical protein
MYELAPGTANRIAPRLFQGAFPPEYTPLKQVGFDVLVLCAKEYQRSSSCYPGVELVRASLDDSGPPPTNEELRQAHAAAHTAGTLWLRGARVLVTCAMGINRSGLVMGITLRDLFGLSGEQAIAQIQECRPDALTNAYFREHLRRMPARPVRYGRWGTGPAWEISGQKMRAATGWDRHQAPPSTLVAPRGLIHP